ncbi:MAG: ATP synthase subunit I [Pseudomonadota bacterium]|nr:ATP synthase subunit I [Pseudomonadota bacterium]
MLKVALPRPSTDAVIRNGLRFEPLPAVETARPFADDGDELAFKPLSRAEAAALLAREPALSPWKVVAAQVAVGAVAAVVAWLALGSPTAAASALYGAAVVVVPGALMARGATSRLSSLSPLVSAVAMLGWASLKILASVLLLGLAARLIPGLHWPVMLVTMAVSLQTYWLALLWRGRPSPSAA